MDKFDTLHRTSQLTKQHFLAYLDLIDAVIDAVKQAGPQGAPAGPMYAAMMTGGVTLEQFEKMMALIVTAGRLRKSGDLYFYVEQPRRRT